MLNWKRWKLSGHVGASQSCCGGSRQPPVAPRQPDGSGGELSLRRRGRGLQKRDAERQRGTWSWKWLVPQGQRQGCCTGVEQRQQLCPETQRAPACPWHPACLPAFAAGMPCGRGEMPPQTQRQRWHLWHAEMLVSCICRSWTHREPECC